MVYYTPTDGLLLLTEPVIRRRHRQHRKQQHKEDYYSLVEEELEVLIMLEMITKNQITINAKRNWYVLIPPANRDLS